MASERRPDDEVDLMVRDEDGVVHMMTATRAELTLAQNRGSQFIYRQINLPTISVSEALAKLRQDDQRLGRA